MRANNNHSLNFSILSYLQKKWTNSNHKAGLIEATLRSGRVIWLKQFGFQRYALPLELLADLMLFPSLDRLLENQEEVAFMFGFLACCGFVD